MDRNKQRETLSSDEAFAELLGRASPRPAPPEADEALIRAAVQAEWQKVSGGHARRRHVRLFAIAASVLLAVFATLNLLRDPADDFGSQQMATIEKRFGDINVNHQVVNAVQMAAIKGGDFIETGPESGLALGWHNGGSLRLDESTVVAFDAENQIYLQQGRVYFDSEAGPFSARPASGDAVEFAIRTDYGVVRHLGTQYMTELGVNELVVSVREGMVSIDGKARATRGQQFAISGAGVVSISDTNGVDDWEWVEKSTPAVSLNGRLVHEALEWVSRESGRTIQYASAAAESLARTTELRGGFYDMEPSRALEIFMKTVDLNARNEGEVIVISED